MRFAQGIAAWTAATVLGTAMALAQAVAPAPATAPAATGGPQASPAEIEFWNTVKDARNPAEFKAYLETYPNGAFAALAKVRIRALEEASSQKKATDDTKAAADAKATADAARAASSANVVPGLAVRASRRSLPPATTTYSALGSAARLKLEANAPPFQAKSCPTKPVVAPAEPPRPVRAPP